MTEVVAQDDTFFLNKNTPPLQLLPMPNAPVTHTLTDSADDT